MTLTALRSLLASHGYHPTGGEKSFSALCPAHADSRESLSVTESTDGKLLVHCFVGCTPKAVVSALGLKMTDLFPDKPKRNGGARRIVATYPYHNETGKVLFECVRYEPKTFKQRHPDPAHSGNWIWNLKNVPRVLYRLPEVIEAVNSGRTVFIAEGEKDVDALVQHGFTATCNPCGAGKWRPEYNRPLTGANVGIIPDKDEPGRRHAAGVAQSLHGSAASVRVVELPDVNGKSAKDAFEFFAAGGTAQQLRAAVEGVSEYVPMAESKPTKVSSVAAEATPDPDAIALQYGSPVFSDGTGVSLNERNFAARFHAKSDVLFEPDERAFYRYEPATGLWSRTTDDAIREALSALVLQYGLDHDLELAPKITTAKMGAMVAALRGIAERRGVFGRPRDFVHVENGVVRFPADGRVVLGGFRPEDFSRNRSPVAFTRNADCPRFINELLRPALPDDDIDLLQRLVGLAVAGVNPAQRLVILDGGAATGKSTIAKIVQKLVGIENTAQLRTPLLFERFEVFRFIGKTLLVAPDVAGDFLNYRAASVLKSLVGGDQLTAEAKGSNAVFSLTGTFNVWITANTRLRVHLDGDAGAWRRRLIILRFENPPPRLKIPNLADVLIAEEGPGILRWALAGFLRAREEIAATGDLVLTTEQQGRVDALLSESDSVRRFVVERTTRGAGNVSSGELVEAYFKFCSVNEWTPQSARVVERALPDLLLEIHGASRAQDIARNGRAVRGWRGVELVTDGVESEVVP